MSGYLTKDKIQLFLSHYRKFNHYHLFSSFIIILSSPSNTHPYPTLCLMIMEANTTITINKQTYRLIELVKQNQSGISDIWKMEDAQGQWVALKTVKQVSFSEASEQQKQEYLKHLHREINFLESLKKTPCHHIIPLLNHGKLDDLPVLVLPFMHQDLSDYIKTTKSIGLVKYLDWCVQISEALSVIHAANYHYRDLKLTNILTDKKGTALKLADFGTVKFNLENELHTYSGTPKFMAPEQMLPATRQLDTKGEYSYSYETDHRTDFFSLGLVLFELITGSKQLTSQEDIQSLRNRQGEQAAWEKRNELGGINQLEIELFRKKLNTLYENNDKETVYHNNDNLTFSPINQQHPCVTSLTALVSSLLARDKCDRPDNANAIIGTLTDILIPLAEDTPVYAFTAKEESPVTPEEDKKTTQPKVLYAISALLSIGVIGAVSTPYIKQSMLNPAYQNPITELPMEDELEIAVIEPKEDATSPIKTTHSTLENINTSPQETKPIEIPNKEPEEEITVPQANNQDQHLQHDIDEEKTTVIPVVTNPPTEALLSGLDDVHKQPPTKKVEPKITAIPITPDQPKKTPAPISTIQELPINPITIKTVESSTKVTLPIDNNKVITTPVKKTSVPTKKQNNNNKLYTPLPSLKMIVIPAGHFTMGDNQGKIDEKPEHPVKIKSFAVSKELISEKQYREYCKKTKKSCATSGQNSDKPIIVTKQQALTYIADLSTNTHPVRLLSEAEWEYLASTNKDRVNFTGQEWVADCSHFNYKNAPSDGSAWLNANQKHCKMDSARNIKNIHNRIPIPYGMKKNNTGFRIATPLLGEPNGK